MTQAGSQATSRRVTGKVISAKMSKTIVVQTERKVRHPLYGKYVRRFSKMYAHDEHQKGQLGDTVVIQMTRPVSKSKHWVLVDILRPSEKPAEGSRVENTAAESE